MKTVYKWWAALLLVAVFVQIGFAGYGAFFVAGKVDDHDLVTKKQFEDGWDLHAGFGYLVVLGALVLLVLALIARPGRPLVLVTLGLAVLAIIQVLLAWIGGSGAPAVGALHPINAVVIAGLTGLIVHRTWNAKA
jgi:hypothetical protein